MDVCARKIGRGLVVALCVVANAACAASFSPLPEPGVNGTANAGRATEKPSRYVYVADRSQEKILVYRAGVKNPKPIRSLGRKDGIVEVGGIAVDTSGNLYVANGNAANVLEFGPGATRRIKKYSNALHHPVNVAVDAPGTVYVVDQDDSYPGGATSSIIEFPKGSLQPSTVLLDPSTTGAPLQGVAVDPQGAVWTSTGGGDTWPPPQSGCTEKTHRDVFEFIFPTLIVLVPVSHNRQAWGLADTGTVLYAADYCSGVQTYNLLLAGSRQRVMWSFERTVPYSTDVPMYATVTNDGLLVIPCAGNGKDGYVRVVGNLGDFVTIRTGLKGPIGAAAGS